MSRDLWGAMTDLAEQFTGAGIRAVMDTRDLNPPCLLITPPDMAFRFADGTWTASWTVIATTPGAGTRDALVSLDDLITRMVKALEGQPVQATPYTLAVDGQSDPLPAYSITWTARVR